MAGYLKIPEVARRLDVSEKTARRYVKAGTLPSTFIGGAYRVSEDGLEEFLHRAEVKPEPAVPLAGAPPKSGLSDLDPSSKLTAASALEEIAELWAEQLARGFYDRRTLGLMRFAGVYLSLTIESAASDYRETLPPNFRAQLEAAEERFADVWVQIWEAREALEEADREQPAPVADLAAKRKAKREEFLKQMRGGGQALTPSNTA